MSYPNIPANEVLTHGVDVNHNFFNFTIDAAGAVGTLSQGAGAFVTSVTKTATGRYTVQFAKPYPASILFINPVLSIASPDGDLVVCQYKSGSYSASAGTFEICVADVDGLDGNALAALLLSAVDPANGASIFVHYAFLNV
jgi:hypothetical protein